MNEENAIIVLKVILRCFLASCNVLVANGIITEEEKQQIVRDTVSDVKKAIGEE